MTELRRPPFIARFAPSPNGLLHLGHAYSALLNFEVARRLGGRFLLRIEDIDPERCRPEFEAAIYRDLEWLGVAWEEPVRRQSQHLATYEAALRGLQERGLAYPAFMSRSEIAKAAGAAPNAWPTDPDGAPLYPPGDRKLAPEAAAVRIAEGHPFAMRLRMAEVTAMAGELRWAELAPGGWREAVGEPTAWGDVILGRRDLPTSYHLAVVLDDGLQGTTHVIRGADLAAATAVHRLLQFLLGLPTPAYCHHRLIRDEAGAKLAKSAASTGLAALRQSGMTALGIRERLGIDREADRVAEACEESVTATPPDRNARTSGPSIGA